ncbi:MAG: hypothetical protein V3T14_11310 [Myxococcota bacterium]
MGSAHLPARHAYRVPWATLEALYPRILRAKLRAGYRRAPLAGALADGARFYVEFEALPEGATGLAHACSSGVEILAAAGGPLPGLAKRSGGVEPPVTPFRPGSR